MFLPKAVYCRIFQKLSRLVLPLLPYRQPEIISSCRDLGAVLKKENISSVLIVTDAGIVKNRLTLSLEESMQASSIKYVIYDKTQPNPTVNNVEEALALYHSACCQAIVTIGGGSSMDCAKAVSARVAYTNRTVGQMKGVLRILRKTPLLVAVPTTAGTGSEVTLAAVITDSEKQDKYALMSFLLIPKYAVLDATLTYSLPPHLTSTTGMDALTHAVEAYIGNSTTKETRQLALEAVELVFNNIETAYAEGTNHQARQNMLLAAFKAGQAFSKSYVGYIHAIAHSLGGRYGIPHGLANAVIMPYVLDAYGEKACVKLHQLGVAAGVSPESDSPQEGAQKFITAIRQLNKNMSIPDKLAGILNEDIPSLAKHAEKEANPLYPVPVLMTAKQLEQIYYQVSDC